MSREKSERARADEMADSIHRREYSAARSPYLPPRLDDPLRIGRREKGISLSRFATSTHHAQWHQSVQRAKRYSFHRRSESCWDIIEEGGDYFHARLGRGGSILELLLQNQGVSFPCLEIVRHTELPIADLLTYSEIGDTSLNISGLGDAGEILDERAKVEYRRRILEVKADLEKAIRSGDEICVRESEEELNFLKSQLAEAEGLGKHIRRAASAAERARVSVQKAITSAIDKVERELLDLGSHLRNSVKTGSFCMYSPDPADRTHCEFY